MWCGVVVSLVVDLVGPCGKLVDMAWRVVSCCVGLCCTTQRSFVLSNVGVAVIDFGGFGTEQPKIRVHARRLQE